jgi:hypothetical protein
MIIIINNIRVHCHPCKNRPEQRKLIPFISVIGKLNVHVLSDSHETSLLYAMKAYGEVAV